MIEYYIIPGYIRSKTDGDIHYINGDALIKLYKLDKSKCIILTPNIRQTDKLISRASLKGITVLTPRYDGDYNV